MVVYLSMGLLSLILGTIMCRLVVMGLTWMVLGRGFWILPNVLSEVSGPCAKAANALGAPQGAAPPLLMICCWRPCSWQLQLGWCCICLLPAG